MPEAPHQPVLTPDMVDMHPGRQRKGRSATARPDGEVREDAYQWSLQTRDATINFLFDEYCALLRAVERYHMEVMPTFTDPRVRALYMGEREQLIRGRNFVVPTIGNQINEAVRWWEGDGK